MGKVGRLRRSWIGSLKKKMDWLWFLQVRRWWIRPSPRTFLLLLFGATFSYQLVSIGFLLAGGGGENPDPEEPDKTLQFKLDPAGTFLRKKVPRYEPPIPPFKAKRKQQRTRNGTCLIPQLDPYDQSIAHLVRVEPSPMECESRYPLLFRSTFDSRILPEKGPEDFPEAGWLSCCYRAVGRGHHPDKGQRLSSKCYPLSFTKETDVPEAHEFIAVLCTNGTGDEVPIDVHAFVPLKPPKKVNQVVAKKKDNNKLNVVILGLDATSRMNFLRTMPQTHSFLKSELGAVEMTGYNKVGAGTFENLIPLLTSRTIPDLPCLNNTYNDECPLIWKNYSDSGYSTCFSDDHFDFNFFSQGFHQPPTDHYPHRLLRWADAHIGSHPMTDGHGCWGPRMTFQFHLDYMEKYVRRMSEAHRNFFLFSWVTLLGHDDQTLTTGALGDAHLLNSLKRLKASGYLNNTLLILMSDHGIRLGNFADTPQGQLEDRLPFIFFLFPDTFKKKYARAYQNLIRNRDKLMTTFDLHQTLLDILDLDKNLNKANLQRRHQSSSSRGLSLFLPIPKSRTCDMAGIPEDLCSCNYLREISLEERPSLLSAAMAAVSKINSLLQGHPQCFPLRLQGITMAQQVGWETEGHAETFRVNFITHPGQGEFQAEVHRKGNQLFWTVQGNITRTNNRRNGRGSRCVEEDPALEPFCDCGHS